MNLKESGRGICEDSGGGNGRKYVITILKIKEKYKTIGS